MELVSAYIPCYNNIDTIAEAVNSIKRQTIAVGELFVIDDGSTDGSADAVESMGVRVIRNERNLGRGAVRNRAMTEAKNEFVLCCDATNILDEDFTKNALHWFNDQKVSAVYGKIVPGQGRQSAAHRWRNRHIFRSDVVFETKHNCLLITCGTIMRKSHVMNAGNFNKDLSNIEDRELGRRLLEKGYDVIFDPSLKIITIADDSLSRVLERYWRWNAERDKSISWHQYAKQILFSIKVMAWQDLCEKDPLRALISLYSPHYQFWKSFFMRNNVTHCK